jgi:LemA protein
MDPLETVPALIGAAMAPMTIVLLVIAAVVVLLILWLVAKYNGLVRLRAQVQNAWAQIDVQLKRRWDLIPNLVETVKGYTKHEAETLQKVTEARKLAQSAAGQGVAKQAEAESMLSGALGRLLAVVEAYPDLKANQNYLALQEELTSTENKIGFSRQFYNDTVMRFNATIQMFPTSIVAGMFHFAASEFFELKDQAAREAPKVQF